MPRGYFKELMVQTSDSWKKRAPWKISEISFWLETTKNDHSREGWGCKCPCPQVSVPFSKMPFYSQNCPFISWNCSFVFQKCTECWITLNVKSFFETFFNMKSSWIQKIKKQNLLPFQAEGFPVLYHGVLLFLNGNILKLWLVVIYTKK